MVKLKPNLVQEARETVLHWLEKGDTGSAGLWREWLVILGASAWRKVLGRSNHAQQLRQASPLVTVLPESMRNNVLAQIAELKKGIVLGGAPPTTNSAPPP